MIYVAEDDGPSRAPVLVAKHDVAGVLFTDFATIRWEPLFLRRGSESQRNRFTTAALWIAYNGSVIISPRQVKVETR